jgi:hypothetical protein
MLVRELLTLVRRRSHSFKVSPRQYGEVRGYIEEMMKIRTSRIEICKIVLYHQGHSPLQVVKCLHRG